MTPFIPLEVHILTSNPENIISADQIETVRNLRQPPTKQVEVAPSVGGRVKNLNLNDLTPSDFERLCLRLVEREATVYTAGIYGGSGTKQYGIDIWAITDGDQEDKYHVYQCKRYVRYTPTLMNAAVQEFLNPKPSKKKKRPDWFNRAKCLTLCVSFDIQKGTDLDNKFVELRESLRKEHGITFDFLDYDRINEKLHQMPEVVEEFFGIRGVEYFCRETKSIPYLQGVKARELLTIPRPNWNPSSNMLPSAMLTARNRIVPLEGRETELEDLCIWAKESITWDLRVITGAGGTGKTRLMLEFCTELKAQGWLAGFMDANTQRTTNLDEWRNLLEQDRPIFVVVDYAESRQSEIVAFLKVLETCNKPVRLVLLARALGEWSNFLEKTSGPRDLLISRQMLERSSSDLKPPSTLESYEAAQKEYQRALVAFAKALGKPVPSSKLSLNPELYKRILFVHMMALVEISGKTVENIKKSDLLDKILGIERHYWSTRLSGESEGFDSEIEQVMTLVSLGWPVSSLEDANKLLKTDPTLNEERPKILKSLAYLLRDTYPGSAYINPIEPDLLAEHLIYTQLNHPEHGSRLIETAFGNAGVEPDLLKVNPDKALAHLVRLAEWQNKTDTLELWQKVLEGRLNNVWHGVNPDGTSGFGDIFLKTAMQYAQRAIFLEFNLGSLLAELLEKSKDSELCRKITENLPYSSVSLGKIIEVALRIGSNSNNERERLINLGNHSIALSGLGFHQAALDQARAAVEGFQNLANLDSKKYMHDLALGFQNQGNCQRNNGDRKGGLESMKRAVKIFRNLPIEDFNSGSLASGLINLGNYLMENSELLSALDSISEAVDIFSILEKQNPEKFKIKFASSLNSKGTIYSRMGKLEKSLIFIGEAINIMEEYCLIDEDSCIVHLANFLNNKGTIQRKLEKLEDAINSIDKAISIQRKLKNIDFVAFSLELGFSLNNRSHCLVEMGYLDNALFSTNEAIDIFRELSVYTPKTALKEVALSLINKNHIQFDLGNFNEALDSINEAEDILIAYYKKDPDSFALFLAQCLNNKSIVLNRLSINDVAISTIESAININRLFLKESPEIFFPELIKSCGMKGHIFLNCKQYREASISFWEGIKYLVLFRRNDIEDIRSLASSIWKDFQYSLSNAEIDLNNDILEEFRILYNNHHN